jgi:hypothetical protein
MVCTDSAGADRGAKAPWESRKRHHIEKLKSADRDVALVTAADKPHNLNAMIRDVRRHGPATLERFNSPGRLAWYYRGVADALEGHEDLALVGEMRERIGVLEGLLGDGGGGRARPPEVPAPDRCPELHLVGRQL